MSNSLFNSLGGNVQTDGIMPMVKQFQQFKQTLNGNPKDIVMNMLQSGKISQSDLNAAQSFAKQFESYFK